MPTSRFHVSRRHVGAVLSSALATSALLLTSSSATHAAPPSDSVLGLPMTSMAGTVVNAATGNPVSRIPVTLRDVGPGHAVLARDRTNANGVFRIDGLTEDEYAVHFNGAPRHFEQGYLGCHRNVVATWGDACSFGTGFDIGKARLEHL